MKRSITLLLLCACLWGYAQEVPESFPRKFLLEHFTGSACGQCPEGMEAIKTYLASQTIPYIWVSHHYGYNSDEYTISESERVGKALGVSGAPNVVINRTKQVGSMAFTPVYLLHPSVTIVDDTVAEASVVINHTYNTASRELTITVSGQVANTEVDKYLLTVLIKENRLVGKQADNKYSMNASPWLEYMHTRTIRDMITPAFGDTIDVVNQAYSHTLTYTIDENWKAENCCIVAYLTPMNRKPIINAEQSPLIAGTTGGEEYLPYGITESAKPKQEIEFDTVQISKISENTLELLFIDQTSIRSNTYGPVKPVVRVYLNTESNELKAGTYPIQSDQALGTITAGYRIDEQTAFGGSLLMYVPAQELVQGNILPAHLWRVNEGEMVVEADGKITFNFTTYNKTSVQTSALNPKTGMTNIHANTNTTRKVMRNNRLVIINNNIEYDILGNRIH